MYNVYIIDNLSNKKTELILGKYWVYYHLRKRDLKGGQWPKN